VRILTAAAFYRAESYLV